MLDLNHKKLRVWKLSIEFVALIYRITRIFPENEKYGLVSQLRRAAVSIPANISEGASRSSPKERKRFYEIARSSLVEIDTELEISKLLNFATCDDLRNISKMMNKLFGMLTILIKHTN